MFLLVYGINVAPAFMPATWVVLAFFYLHFGLAILPTVILGALAATTGRIFLWYIAKHFFSRFIGKKARENYKALGAYLSEKKHISIFLIIFYAFLPIPSNQSFIAAGLAHFDVELMAVSFLVGRLASYTFWLTASTTVVVTIDQVFNTSLSPFHLVVVEGGVVLSLVLMSLIPWKKIVEI